MEYTLKLSALYS